jgi:serine/threonine protein phosphatase 1
MRRLVIGDIHGNLAGLKQALQRAQFDPTRDQIISLGDIADGWHEVYEVVDFFIELNKIAPGRHVYIKGNHDDWFLEALKTGKHPASWGQGADKTLKSYAQKILGRSLSGYDMYKAMHEGLMPMQLPLEHLNFWYYQKKYYIDDKNYFFVHGGLNRHEPVDVTEALHPDVFWWDRDFWNVALSTNSMSRGHLDPNVKASPKVKTKNNFARIFIGHTSTQFWDSEEPMKACQVWNLDTGAGWRGKLTVMDADTEEYWQSDKAMVLYPGMIGRG